MATFTQAGTVELEATTLTTEDRKEEIRRECKEAGRQLKAAVTAERNYNVAHPQHPFRFRAGDSLFVQTMANDPERRRLQCDVRNSVQRWNQALRQLALFENPRLIL
jgi:hypothetical protein